MFFAATASFRLYRSVSTAKPAARARSFREKPHNGCDLQKSRWRMPRQVRVPLMRPGPGRFQERFETGDHKKDRQKPARPYYSCRIWSDEGQGRKGQASKSTVRPQKYRAVRKKGSQPTWNPPVASSDLCSHTALCGLRTDMSGNGRGMICRNG